MTNLSDPKGRQALLNHGAEDALHPFGFKIEDVVGEEQDTLFSQPSNLLFYLVKDPLDGELPDCVAAEGRHTAERAVERTPAAGKDGDDSISPHALYEGQVGYWKAVKITLEGPVWIVNLFPAGVERKPRYLRKVSGGLDCPYELHDCILAFAPNDEVGMVEGLVRKKGGVVSSDDDRGTRPPDNVRNCVGARRGRCDSRDSNEICMHDF